MQITDPRVEAYIRSLLARHDDPVLQEMEREAEAKDFPIVGRMVGAVLEILARGIGARRVFELGSGYGYSAYWFSRAIGPDGELHLTDADPENERKALDYLRRAGLGGPLQFHVGEAVSALEGVQGEFDVVFCDVDKGGYPSAWNAARNRIRRGGLYLCDNTLGWGGASVVAPEEGGRREWIEAVREHNEAIFSDPEYLAAILPIRDGVLTALRV